MYWVRHIWFNHLQTDFIRKAQEKSSGCSCYYSASAFWSNSELFATDHAEVYQQLYRLCDNLLEDDVDVHFSHAKHIHITMKVFLKSNVSSEFEAFVACKSGLPTMFSFFWLYMELAFTLLNFIRESRQGLWLLHLSSLEKLCGLSSTRTG